MPRAAGGWRWWPGVARRYRRWLRQDPPGTRDLGVNPYGCADAANLLYSIGRFPGSAGERLAWVDALRSLQDPGDGLFHEATHHEIHTTAHCVAALELFDARPARSLAGLFNPVLYPGVGTSLPVSQEELGQLAGLSRQRVNQALQRLAADGLLQVDYGSVTVLDLDGLRRYGE